MEDDPENVIHDRQYFWDFVNKIPTLLNYEKSCSSFLVNNKKICQTELKKLKRNYQRHQLMNRTRKWISDELEKEFT